MEFRSIFIANPAHLSVHRNQLVIQQELVATIPMEDISSILIESQAVTITAAAIQELSANGVTVYFCDRTHMPSALVLPMNQNCRQYKLLKEQFSLSLPSKKRIWKSVVSAKIQNQAKCLELLHIPEANELYYLAEEVQAGDSGNKEAVAAAKYFSALFGRDFTREDDSVINACLNYGYAILRGAVARNLVIRGLEPCMGIFHHNELNQFNLADDLMEPYRPLVDLFVASFITEECSMTPQIKHQLFNLSNYLIEQGGKKYKAVAAVGRMADSFVRILHGQERNIEVPLLLPLQEYHYE